MNKLALALLVPALVGCGGATGYTPTPVHTSSAPVVSRPTHTPTHTAKPKATPHTTKPRATANSKMFKTCVEAYEKKHVPVYKWEPQYNPKLDTNHNGIACEHEDG